MSAHICLLNLLFLPLKSEVKLKRMQDLVLQWTHRSGHFASTDFKAKATDEQNESEFGPIECWPWGLKHRFSNKEKCPKRAIKSQETISELCFKSCLAMSCQQKQWNLKSERPTLQNSPR